MDECQKVTFASLHFTGRAVLWYQSDQMGRLGTRWATLVEDVCARFEELGHDVVAEFNKL